MQRFRLRGILHRFRLMQRSLWSAAETASNHTQTRINNFREQHTETWEWLNTGKLSLKIINRLTWRGALPSWNYYLLLGCSGVIAALGLLANSAATIIGAMIVAPMMGPITAIGFAFAVNNRRMLKRSSFTLLTGILLTVVIALLLTRFIGISSLGSEIQGRVKPTLLDLGVALAAGAAGAFARSRRGIADALPGVAIAVALVPPLGVVGIGLGLADLQVAYGATILFLTNLVGIIFSSTVIFILLQYGNLRKARRGLGMAGISLLVLAMPLGLALQNLLVQEQVQYELERLLRRETLTFSRVEISEVKVFQGRRPMLVFVEVMAPTDAVSEKQAELVREFLQTELRRTIQLKVRVLPITEIDAPPLAPKETSEPQTEHLLEREIGR